jgi:ATP-dependent Clp protease ATP-binding subunit ClpC
MFEKYTEQARRTIFFARYEVAQLGGESIEPEHLLLGLLREDRVVLPPLLGEREHAVKRAIRAQVEGRSAGREKLPDNIELPLSGASQNVLKYAAEQSEGMSHKHIGTEHLLLGLSRAEGTFAAEVLHGHGIDYEAVSRMLTGTYGQ